MQHFINFFKGTKWNLNKTFAFFIKELDKYFPKHSQFSDLKAFRVKQLLSFHSFHAIQKRILLQTKKLKSAGSSLNCLTKADRYQKYIFSVEQLFHLILLNILFMLRNGTNYQEWTENRPWLTYAFVIFKSNLMWGIFDSIFSPTFDSFVCEHFPVLNMNLSRLKFFNFSNRESISFETSVCIKCVIVADYSYTLNRFHFL